MEFSWQGYRSLSLLQGIFPTQGSNPDLLHCRSILDIRATVVQLLSQVWLFDTPQIAARQAPCPPPSPRVCSNSHPLSWWFDPAISSSAAHFSICLQSFLASEPFPMWGSYVGPFKRSRIHISSSEKKGFLQAGNSPRTIPGAALKLQIGLRLSVLPSQGSCALRMLWVIPTQWR